MVDTSSLAGVMRASRRPQADQSTRRTAGVRRPATQEQPSFLDQLGENFLRGQQAQIRSNAVDNPFNPVPVSSSAVFEGRMPTAGELGTDAAFLAGGALLGAAARPISNVVRRTVPAFQPRNVRQAALMSRILNDPATYVQTTRSTGSLDDILNSGFRSSRQTGVTSSGTGNVGQYNALREAAESAAFNPEATNVQYGALVSPVLRNQPRPFQIGAGGREALQDYLATARALDPRATAYYGSQAGNQPIQYVWSPEAMRNARFYYGDSMFNQSTGGGADYTRSFADFLNDFANPGSSGYIRSRPPSPYVEAQIPSLSLDDVVAIQSLNSGRTGQNVVSQIDEALANAGRSIPTGVAPSAADSAFDMPPTVRENVLARLQAFNRRLFPEAFEPRRPGMSLEDWEALELQTTPPPAF